MNKQTSESKQKCTNVVNESQVLEQAAEILSKRTFGGQSFNSAEDTKTFLP
jgi:hypothetical protein